MTDSALLLDEEWTSKKFPAVFFGWSAPLFGAYPESIAAINSATQDELDGIAIRISQILRKLAIPLWERHTLQVGNEFHRFVLDDAWPAVPGAAPMMGPNPFVNINDGHRTGLALFAEVASKWNSKWTTLLGIRNDAVWTNAAPVSGYSDMYAMDADAFNALNRSRSDIDFDAGRLTIKRSVEMFDGKRREKAPKTTRSARTLAAASAQGPRSGRETAAPSATGG